LRDNGKFLIHSTRDIADVKKSWNTLTKEKESFECTDNLPSVEYLEMYDKQGREECDILFHYQDIFFDKAKEVNRLVHFYKEKGLLENNAIINIQEVIKYADTIPLPLKKP
jgi:hypothetical protein